MEKILLFRPISQFFVQSDIFAFVRPVAECLVVTILVFLQDMPGLFWPCSPSTCCPAVRGPPSSVTCSAVSSIPLMATPHGL